MRLHSRFLSSLFSPLQRLVLKERRLVSLSLSLAQPFLLSSVLLSLSPLGIVSPL